MTIKSLSATFDTTTRILELHMSLPEEGGAEIHVKPGEPIELFEIRLYGGDPQESGTYPDIATAIETALAWT